MIEETFNNNYQSADFNNNEIFDGYINFNIPVETFQLNFQDYDNNNQSNDDNDNEDDLYYDCQSSGNITPRWINILSKSDALTTEFEYYKKLIPEIILQVNQEERENIQKWIDKLSTPAYNIIKLRDKRNHFMLMLCITLISGNLSGPFNQSPPDGILPDIDKIHKPIIESFEWEQDDMWKNQLDNQKIQLKLKKRLKRCPLHRKACPKDTTIINNNIGTFLDKQFQFLLFIYKSYTENLNAVGQVTVTKCIQILCNIDQSYCLTTKSIRNQYMIILFTYLADQSLIEQFVKFLSELAVLYECCECFNNVKYRNFCKNNNKETADLFFDYMEQPPMNGNLRK